ncbi:MAG: twin-arginine translocation signal domain-containing protein [Nitrospiraceae bacterium]
MEVDRRSLMKGLLAGGALLALGTPPWAFAAEPGRKAKQILLFLGSTSADDAVAKGVSAAGTAVGYGRVQAVKVNGGLLSDPDGMVALLEQSKGLRWIAVMDDAAASVFQELARSAGGRLLSIGTHACSTDASCPLRHAWLTVSPAQGMGGLLASQLIGRQGSFSITESFLQEPLEGRAPASWSAPGFCSYRLTGPDAMHLHCSGLSLPESGRLLGLDTTEGWTPIPLQVCKRDFVAWQAESWIESVGYAVTATALGVHSVRESCSARAFVHQSQNDERIQPTERFVSFVMDL